MAHLKVAGRCWESLSVGPLCTRSYGATLADMCRKTGFVRFCKFNHAIRYNNNNCFFSGLRLDSRCEATCFKTICRSDTERGGRRCHFTCTLGQWTSPDPVSVFLDKDRLWRAESIKETDETEPSQY
jgi:hypothetical protein